MTKKELLTKTEFAKLCGIQLNTLSVYITRKKVVCNGKLIDPLNEINQLYIANCKRTTEKKRTSESGQTLVELEKTLKELDRDKRKKEISLLTLKESKLKGELIPVHLVADLITVYAKSINDEFLQVNRQIINEISHRKRLSSTEQAEIKSQLTGILNKSISKAKDQTKKQMAKIINEYSETRGPGERM